MSLSRFENKYRKYEIWGFDGGDDNDDVLLGLGVVWTG
jgi:hypothetical protein